jgi:hypothetical protein
VSAGTARSTLAADKGLACPCPPQVVPPQALQGRPVPPYGLVLPVAARRPLGGLSGPGDPVTSTKGHPQLQAVLLLPDAATSCLRSVGQVDHTVLVRLTGHKRQVAGWGFLWQEARTGPAGERVDEQMQLIDQAVGEHRSDQRAAAGDVEVAVDLVLQAADRGGVRQAVASFVATYNTGWLIGRVGHRTPKEAYQDAITTAAA